MRTAAIVGGGISGLSTAYYLNKAGQGATLIESRPRLGGVIQTDTVEGCVIEAGPDSFLSAKPAAMELIRDLGLADEVIGSNDHLRKTYVWKGGRLVALPDGLMFMVPTRIAPMIGSPLLSWGTKTRMGLEWFRAPAPKPEDQSVADFVEQHYGREAVDYLAEPLLSGIYGGHPSALSVRAVLPRFVELSEKYGSLTKGVLAEMRSAKAQSGGAPLFRTLKRGLAQMVQAIEARVPIDRVQGRAETVERTPEGYRVRVGGEWIETRSLVLACEAHNVGALVAQLDPRLGELLSSVPYSSSMTLALGYRRERLKHPLDGFGFLVPQVERRRLVACTWVGTKFPHRVPGDWAVLRCFLGGMNNAAVLDESDSTLTAEVLAELKDIMGIDAQPDFVRFYRWPRSMAQYTVGHQQRLAEIQGRMAAFPGLYLAGNAYHGIGIPDCIRMGKQAAEAIAAKV